MTDRPWYEDVAVPSLMRAARDVYRAEIAHALAAAGCDDVPRNGVFVLADLDQSVPEPKFSPQADVVTSLGLSKQAASQLIDTLVLRRYLERRADPEDRRRVEVRLTGRGRTAALAIQAAIDAIETALARLITGDQLHGLRAGLAAFRELRARSADGVARRARGSDDR
jgi:DNA-binding MarR family transcriptional regulator